MLKTSISVLYLAKANLTGRRLLEAMEYEGMQVDVQVNQDFNVIDIKAENYDFIIISEEIVNDTS